MFIMSDNLVGPLPQPNEGFEWVQAPAGPALVCRPLARLAPHLFTTRAWWSAASVTVDGDGLWRDVARTMGLAPENVARLRQVHGAVVATAATALGQRIEGDILIGDDSAAALGVQAADCVPLLLADRRVPAVAAAHAGWRGLAAGVPGAAVAAFAREFGSRPADLVAAAGPSIGACCYEVGSDVRNAFASAGFGHDALARWFSTDPTPSDRNPSMPALARGRPGHWFFNGWAALGEQLQVAGIPSRQIFIAGLCTASHPRWFHSFRREGARAGRQAGVIRSRPLRP
jgi:YfiH family protein